MTSDVTYGFGSFRLDIGERRLTREGLAVPLRTKLFDTLRVLVEHSGRQYTLRATSALRREFILLDGSTRIGSLSPDGIFTRRADVDLPSTLPLTVRVFIIWLTVMLWKHDEAAAGAAAVG